MPSAASPHLPLDLRAPVTVAEAFAALRAHAEWTRDYAGTGRRRAEISGATVAVLVSPARAARRLATGQSDADIDGVDVRRYLPDLARHANRAKGADGRRRVEQLLRELTDGTLGHSMKAPERFVAAEWGPLHAACAEVGGAPSLIVYLQRAAQEAGCVDPRVGLPAYHELRAAAVRCGLSRDRFSHAATLYRRCRERLAERGIEFPAFPVQRTPRSTLDGLSSAMLEAELPALAADLRTYCEGATPEGMQSLSGVWKEDVEGSVLRWAAALRRAVDAGAIPDLTSADLAYISALDFLEFAVRIETVVAPAVRSLAERRARSEAAEVPPAAGAGPAVRLVEFLLKREAPSARRRSPFPSVRSAMSGYTEALHRDLVALGSVVRRVHGPDLASTKGGSPVRWDGIIASYERLERTVRTAVLKGLPNEAKNKVQVIEQITLPQAVCVGLPWFRRFVVEPARVAYHAATAEALAAGHTAVHPQVVARGRAYLRVLEEYLMTALVLEDGLRVKNYCNATWGRGGNLVPTYRGGVLVALRSQWVGNVADPAGLKVWHIKGVRQHRPLRDVRPGYVDLGLLDEYVHGFREGLLRARGLLAPGEPYNPEDGRFPLFVSTRSPRGGRRRKFKAPCSYTEHVVSIDRVGRTLHRLAREALGREIPPWNACGARWRAAWAAHVTRLLTVTYWLGVRRNPDVATLLTMDRESVLLDHYKVELTYLADRMHGTVSTWEHPAAYDAWMDRLYFGKEAFDPLDNAALPLPPAMAQLLESNRTGRAILLPVKQRRKTGPQFRRPRPGQLGPGQARPRENAPAGVPGGGRAA